MVDGNSTVNTPSSGRYEHRVYTYSMREKIIDVAGALGYDSPSAFATMFKKQLGTAPSQFFK